jgi:hypothetical protein
MYDPKIARFLQEDTYRGDPNDPLSLNLYTYCANNPLIYFDPTGHDLWKLSTLLSYAEGEMYEKNGILYITANGISREYSKDELFNYEGEYIIDDDLFRLDFNYHKSFFDFFKKKLRLDDNNNDILSLNKFEFTLKDLSETAGYELLSDHEKIFFEWIVGNYGYVGFAFAASKLDDLNQILYKKATLNSREAYSFGLAENSSALLELTYIAEKNGCTFEEMVCKYQKLLQAERTALLAFMKSNILARCANLPTGYTESKGPDDPGYYYINGKKVYYEKPVGYMFEKNAQFARDGSQTAFSVLYPDGRLLWDEGTSKTLNSFDDVADYIKKNGKLPDNFITKDQAKALGWDPKKGNLADVAPGKSIGGDIFKNKGTPLPDAPGRVWYEADINYSGGFRGTDRIIYSNDGLIYKTSDHYKTFTQIK